MQLRLLSSLSRKYFFFKNVTTEILTCRAVVSRIPHITYTNALLVQVRFTVSIVITRRTSGESQGAAFGRVDHFEGVLEIVHMFIVDNFSYASYKTRVIEVWI